MKRRVLLVRHPAVARRWADRCYGHTDVGWSQDGRRAARELVAKMVAQGPQLVIHSGLRRTRDLADAIGRRCQVEVRADIRWRERNFGSWEGRTWKSIWQEEGAAMDGMLTDPGRFRPGGGETTAELIVRALSAWHALPNAELVAVIAHGGSIAAIQMNLKRAPITEIATFIPRCGEMISLAAYPASYSPTHELRNKRQETRAK